MIIHILTGTPGAGKTTLLRRLELCGHAVIEEAATDVIAQANGRGVDEPRLSPQFIVDIVALQKARRLALGDHPADLVFFDRSAVCTLALSRYLGMPPPPSLEAEIDDMLACGAVSRRVLFVENLGFCTPTQARRISFEESLVFEAIHREAYLEFGFECVSIPAAPLEERYRHVMSAVGAS